jgi:aryl-phospho-beta-D-glucosidase BglC (GH1 family)
MDMKANRRDFLRNAGIGAATLAAGADAFARGVKPKGIPRWRGFNLLNFYQALAPGEWSSLAIDEDFCRWISDWGFDFLRIPMDYWFWVDSDCRETRTLNPGDVNKIRESVLEKVDRMIDTAGKYGLHVSLNFHRAPGYCINDPEREPFVLWRDKAAQDAFYFHWGVFAKRYKGVSPRKLSFNLLNEAPSAREGYMSREDYITIMSNAAAVIRSHSPKRPIIVDGLSVGNDVIPELIPLNIIQSVHGYIPALISHYRASWVDKGAFPTPTWPTAPDANGKPWDRSRLEEHYTQWGELAARGVGVHCGECGCWNRTPYPVFLAWFGDVMDILKGYGIGYSLWQFQGGFGVLDSGRDDVQYEDWYGHKLDRSLLTLLQKY